MADEVYNISSDVEDSQNFVLKLTNSVIIDETLDENKFEIKDKEKEVIVIRDSSDDSFEFTPKINKNQEPLKFHNKNDKNHNLSISSFDASEIFTEDDTKSSWGTNKIYPSNANKINNYKASVSNKENKNPHNITIKKTSNINERVNEDLVNQPKQAIPNHINSNNKYENKPRDSPNSVKLGIKTTPLTKKVMRNILKSVKSKRRVYDSPGQWSQNQRNMVSSSESDTSENSSDNEHHDSPVTKKKIHPAWVDETDSEIEDTKNIQNKPSSVEKHQIIQGINKISLQNNALQNDALDEFQSDAFERKRQDISRWLIANSFNRRSDSSVSHVPPSDRNSINSGNSSLERLEENYQTPNNRDKFQSKLLCQDSESGKVNSATGSIKINPIKETSNSTSKKSKQNPSVPLSLSSSSKPRTNSSSSSGKASSKDVDSCVDILNKIYGNSWKDHANILLPNTPTLNDRKPLVQDNRKVQSDYKINIKTRKKNKDPLINKSNTPEENPRTTSRITSTSVKKSNVKNEKYQDSFINDSSLDDTDSDTTYLTALTTPIIPQRQLLKKTTASTLKKVYEICDSDSDNNNDNVRRKNDENYQRRLDFSNHEKSSSTSEFDPDDFIPPKVVAKLCTGTRSNVRSKPNIKSQNNVEVSFLKSLSASVSIDVAHPSAIKYRTNFKKNRDELCNYLFKYFNEKVFEKKLPDDMLIEWSTRMRGTAGFCYNKSKRKVSGGVERSSRIKLATKVLDSAERLRDTLIHEMCHAATWIVNECSNGHGAFWRAWATKAMRIFPELPPIKRCHDYKIATKFTYRCTTCGYSIGRHSKSLDIARKRCGHCYGKFELLINRTTKSGRIEPETPKTRQISKFALFVKENYHDIKKKNQNIDHKEIMKLLGQEFSSMKIAKENV